MNFKLEDVIIPATNVDRAKAFYERAGFPWGSFTFFAEPDGNRCSVQQVPPRNRS